MAAIVKLLEKEAGFQPVNDVVLEMRGQLVRRKGKLVFEVGGTGQPFEVKRIERKQGGLSA